VRKKVILINNWSSDHRGHHGIDGLSRFHNHLSMRARAYQNAVWIIGTAKCDTEEGWKMPGQSDIIALSGRIPTQAESPDDEIMTTRNDWDLGRRCCEAIYNLANCPTHQA
jgi:N-carbamoyl-D-amino-acid hydrolase